MKKVFLTLIILVTTLTAMAQATQPCVVKQYNQKQQKTPLAGVQVEVRDAGSAASGADGRLTLSFRTLKPGDRVPFRAATKAGFELMNKTAVEQWNISRDQKPFEIVLIQSAYFTQLKGKLKQSSIDSYHEKYEKARAILEKLQKEGKMKEEEYLRRLNELEDRYDNQLKNLDAYVDQFARIDLSELSEQEQHFVELAHAGRLDEAAEAYNSLNAAGKYITAVENVRKLNEDIAKLENEKAKQQEAAQTFFAMLQRQVNTLKLAGGEENYKKAGELLKRAALADITNVEVVNEYAKFAYNQDDFKEAERFWLICLDGIGNDNINKAVILNNLGESSTKNVKYENAKEYLFQALELWTVMFQSFPETFRGNISMTQNNLGNLYYKLLDFTKAEEYYLKALENKSLLFTQNPDTYREELANIQNNLGLMYASNDDTTKAEAFFIKSLENLTILYNQNPDTYRAQLAGVQNNLGLFYSHIHSYSKAEESSLQALSKISHLYQHNPDAYRSLLARTQLSIGVMYKDSTDYPKAEQYCLQALATFTTLFAQNPEQYRSNLAFAQSHLADIYNETQDYKKAEEYYLKALENYDQLFNQDPETYRSDLAAIQSKLSLFYKNLDDEAKSKDYIKKTMENYTHLYNQHTDLFHEESDSKSEESQALNLFEANLNISKGGTLALGGNYEEAEGCFLKSLEILGKINNLSKDNEEIYYKTLASSQYCIGLLYEIQKKYDEAEVYYLKSLEHRTQLFSNNPDAYREDLARSQSGLGSLYHDLHNYAKAKEYYLKALENHGELFKQDSDVYRKDIAKTQRCLGDLHDDTKDYVKAEEYYLQALENYKFLFEKQPDEYRAKLAWIQYSLMYIYAKDKARLDQYETMLDAALTNYEVLYQNDKDYQSKIVNLRNRKGWQLLKKGKTDEAMSLFESTYQLDPKKSTSYLASGCNAKAYEQAKTGDFTKALETIDHAITLMPEEANYYDSKGEILLMKGDEQEAVKMWKKVLELNPQFVEQMGEYSNLYKQLKEKGLVE